MFVALVLEPACRESNRGLRVGATAATAKITLANLDTADHGRQDWTYELSGCLDAVTGTLGENDIVSFSSPSIKKDLDGCEVRVKVMKPLDSMVFASGSEAGVLYWAKDIKISEDLNGALSASAPLQKLYNNVPTADAQKSFTLQVPVTFPAAETGTPVTAALSCSPEIPNIGVYKATSDTQGAFSFAVAINSDTSFACTEMIVNVNGVAQKYRANFKTDAGKITGSPAQTVTTQTVTLSLTQTPSPTGGSAGVVVSTTSDAGVCPDGQEYDSTTHACIAAAY